MKKRIFIVLILILTISCCGIFVGCKNSHDIEKLNDYKRKNIYVHDFEIAKKAFSNDLITPKDVESSDELWIEVICYDCTRPSAFMKNLEKKNFQKTTKAVIWDVSIGEVSFSVAVQRTDKTKSGNIDIENVKVGDYNLELSDRTIRMYDKGLYYRFKLHQLDNDKVESEQKIMLDDVKNLLLA